MKCIFLLLVGFLISSSAWAEPDKKVTHDLLDPVSVHLLQKIADEMPALRELHRMVLIHAGIERDAPKQWADRSKWAAALPRFQVGVRHSLKDNLDLKLEDSVSVTGSGVVIGPRSSDFTERSNRDLQLDFRAVWALDELIFNTDVIFVSREARERRKEIRQLLDEANQLYFSWQQWKALLVRKGTESGVPRAQSVLRLGVITAQLDAMTGGWFSETIARKGVER